MAVNPELLAEAHRRGILPPDKAALYQEAVRRGLIEAPQDKPLAVRAGESLMQVPRQLGLAARYAVEGAAGIPATVANVPGMIYNAGADAIQGEGQGFRFKEQNQAVSDALTRLGLPQPEGANERVIGDAARMAAGAGGLVGGARALASRAAGPAAELLSTIAANPAVQAQSAVGAGLAGGAVREAGGGPVAQFLASLAGGIAAPAAVSGVTRAGEAAASAVRNRLPGRDLVQEARVAFERAGVNWNALSADAQASIVQDAQAALRSGRPLDAAALRRLAEYRAIGATPLTGDITQDPRLITQQRNLAKTQANMMAAGGPDLAGIQNQNARRVIETLDDVQGRSPADAYATGQAVIERVQGVDDALRTREQALYGAARGAAGHDIPLQRGDFVNRAFAELARENKDPFLPAEIRNVLNNIQRGTVSVNGQDVAVPFDVASIDKLKTMLATATRGSGDGNTRAALAIVRDALDETQPQIDARSFGGQQVATGAQAAQMAMPAEAMRLLDRARNFARARRNWQESATFIEDALTVAEPDRFVQKHIVNGTVENLRGIRRLSGSSQVLRDSVRAQIVDYIKRRGSVRPDVVGFTSKGLEDGFNAIGQRKLALYFTPAEINRMRSAISVAKYSQAQPIGSAVNNSNTAATVIGKLLDGLVKGSAWVPFGNAMVSGPVQAARVTLSARNAARAGKVLAQPAPRGSLPNPAAGLAAAAAVPPRQDDRRR